MGFVLFAHLLGSALWIGGALAAMVIAIGVKGEQAAVRAGVFRLLAKVHTLVIGVGAMLAVSTGVLLTMRLSTGVFFRRTTLSTGHAAGEPSNHWDSSDCAGLPDSPDQWVCIPRFSGDDSEPISQNEGTRAQRP